MVPSGRAKVSTGLRLTAETHRRLREVAFELDVPMTHLIEAAVLELLGRPRAEIVQVVLKHMGGEA